MTWTIRPYDVKDFNALHRLDKSCFPPGISYSKWTLQYFLNLPSADCLVAEEDRHIVGFILAEQNPPLGHIITLDIADSHRRKGVGTALVSDIEKHLVAMTPLGRMGTPEDIAKVVAFLASDDSGWLTGEVILASGGLR